ncbi:glycosyltransferase family 2 protein [Mucisphaera sp.]|uniref:glycosyltransferase family 2 protein n=1 Tax=Mucisphaera sp. TaxID=2913024 RepID=UPI003D0F3047
MSRTLVAIPVYNEERYVTSVLSRVSAYADDILVIDDGSTDDTPSLLAKQPVDVIRHRTNLGYGRSIRDAFRWAQSYRYDWLITMDCDEQHEPSSLPDFYRAIGEDDADVLSGSRYLDVKVCGDPPPEDRRKINSEVTRWVNDCLGMSVTDTFCGFKAYRVSSLSSFDLTVDGYAIPLQFWVQSAAAGLRVREVPIRLIYNDPNRSFGGPLDDPVTRLDHYKEVFRDEITKHPALAKSTPSPCLSGG